MKPLVSILIPAYNAERWIAETIQSALDQTSARKEIIVVDDGSSDQTLKIARRFACKTVSVVSQQNRGASATRNHALALSKGEYIQWLDADDLLGPTKIEETNGSGPQGAESAHPAFLRLGILPCIVRQRPGSSNGPLVQFGPFGMVASENGTATFICKRRPGSSVVN